MKTTTNPTRFRVGRTAIFLIIVVAVVVSARVALRSEWMRGLVLDQLRSVVLKVGGPAYSLKIGKVDIDPIGGDLAITDIALDHDTTLLDSLRHGHIRYLLSAEAGRVSVSGLSYWHLLFDGQVRVASMHVSGPVMHYTYASHRGARAARTPHSEAKSRPPELVSIGDLVIDHASGTVIDITERSPELSVKRMDLRAGQMRLVFPEDGEAAEWEVGKAQVEIQDVRAELPPLYDLSIAHIGLLHPEGIAMIDSLRYKPRVDRQNTHEHLKEMTSIYTLDVDRIALTHFDMFRAFAEQQVQVGLLMVDGANFDVFLDKTLPVDPSHFMPLPVSALRRIPFGISVDTLRLSHAEMMYAERFEVANGYGSMHMTDIGVTLFNVSNDTLLAIAGKALHGVVDAKLFEVGALHGTYTAPLDSRNDAFALNATLRDMPLTAVNTMCENLLLLRADSGWISSLKLHLNANNDSAIGTFALKYDDAWLQVLNDDGSKRRFLTSMANTAVHHASNDRPADERTMQLRIARKKDHSFFNFVWICTREGLTRTLLPTALADIQSAMMKQKSHRLKKADRRKAKKEKKK